MNKHDCLHEAKKALNFLVQDVTNREEYSKVVKEVHGAYKSQLEVLQENLDKLEREYEELKSEIEILDKKESSSLDARKMYGDVTPGDITHEEVKLLYSNYFKTGFHALPKALSARKEEKYNVWKVISAIVQKCYEVNKDVVTDEIMEKLQMVLVNPLLNDDGLIDASIDEEKKADLYRAFHVFVVEMSEKDHMRQKQGASSFAESFLSLEGIKEKLRTELPDQEQDINLVADLITKLDPENYFTFIKMKSSKQFYPTDRATEFWGKGTSCPACRKGFQTEDSTVPIHYSGLNWHLNHYYCARCQKVIEYKSGLQCRYNEYHDVTFCSHCLCTKCKQPLLEKCFDDKNGLLYHFDCVLLKCKHCRGSITHSDDENSLKCKQCQ